MNSHHLDSDLVDGFGQTESQAPVNGGTYTIIWLVASLLIVERGFRREKQCPRILQGSISPSRMIC